MNNRKQPAFPYTECFTEQDELPTFARNNHYGFTKEEYCTLQIMKALLGTTKPVVMEAIGGVASILHPSPRSIVLLARKLAKELLDQLDLDNATVNVPPQADPDREEKPTFYDGIDLKDN